MTIDDTQQRALDRLAAGRCPKHNIPLVERGTEPRLESYCPECEAERDHWAIVG